MKEEPCFICCHEVPLTEFKYCTCKMNVCGQCLITWNEHTDPRLLCPVCRTCYGIKQQIFFSELTHRIIYYNQLNAIKRFIVFIIVIGMLILLGGLYTIFK